MLELADVIVVNKYDIDGAQRVVNDLKMSLSINQEPPPIITTSALTGDGINELVKMMLSLEERESSKRARCRQQLIMAHENTIVNNPNFEEVIDRISQEGLSIEEALMELID